MLRYAQVAVFSLLFLAAFSRPSEYIDSLFLDEDQIEEMDPGIVSATTAEPEHLTRETPERESIGKDVPGRRISHNNAGTISKTGSRPNLDERENQEIGLGNRDEKKGERVSDETIALASVSSAGALAVIAFLARFLWRAYQDGVMAFEWADAVYDGLRAVWDRLQVMVANIRHPPRIGGTLALRAS